MKKAVAITGNAGPKVRSDCEVILELKDTGGICIELVSKVKSLYGESITKLTNEILAFYSIENCLVSINDSGALPFVISARLESAIKKLINTDLDFIPEFNKNNNYCTEHDRFRFARLYIPGNSPWLMINAGLHSADGVILDLEDSVAPAKKDEARVLVRNALRQVDFYGAERMVRINQGTRGLEDLHFVIPQNVNLIIIAKCESADYVRKVESEITEIKTKYRIENPVFLMPIIESALGVENAFEIARSSRNVVAIAIGLEDYTADLGVSKTNGGRESLYARTRLVVAAKAASVQPIDSVFSDVGDMDALRDYVNTSKALGFEGMGCIHPRQIKVIKDAFTPEPSEIDKAARIVVAFREAEKKGLGVVSIGTKMIDSPVVIRALKTIKLADKLNMLPKDWDRDEKWND